MGFDHGATCADCHGSHDILRAGNPASSVAPANLLNTCRKCHTNATAGFATFQPHATTDDFAHYPYTWIASKFVNLAVGGVLIFFWIHSALWFFREFRDRQQGKPRPHVRADAVPQGEVRYVERWSAMWRWAHLLFAVSIILLVATGITLLYPNTAWAPVLERALGGPEIAGIIHRVSAVVMCAVFAWHILYAAVHIARNWSSFKVFGPYSLMPNWQDAADFAAMFKWFIGRRARPSFDHWNYQQKVDYWAPFWGIAMLVATGALLWFKTLTAAYLPGWVFNVATVAHGDEALLAAAYLFTVHYFVNHWRPDKFPLDVVMFTGAMPLEEFKREYAVEYARLAETGQLQQHLVDAPSRPLTFGAKVSRLRARLRRSGALGDDGYRFRRPSIVSRIEPGGIRRSMATNTRGIALYYATHDGQSRRIAERIFAPAGGIRHRRPAARRGRNAGAGRTSRPRRWWCWWRPCVTASICRRRNDFSRRMARLPRRRRWHLPRSISPRASRKKRRRPATPICARPSRATA